MTSFQIRNGKLTEALQLVFAIMKEVIPKVDSFPFNDSLIGISADLRSDFQGIDF